MNESDPRTWIVVVILIVLALGVVIWAGIDEFYG